MKQIVLALDTSQGTSVAVLVDGKVVAEAADSNPMRHAENIGTLIARCIEQAGVSSAEVTDVAVGIGPGPFTGLRVGIAAAKMFAALAAENVNIKVIVRARVGAGCRSCRWIVSPCPAIRRPPSRPHSGQLPQRA